MTALQIDHSAMKLGRVRRTFICEHCKDEFSPWRPRNKPRFCGRKCALFDARNHRAFGPRIPETKIVEGLSLVAAGATWKAAAATIGINEMTLRYRSTGHVHRVGPNVARKPSTVRLPDAATDLAYLAALLDGEGSITISTPPSTKRLAVRVGISNTHLGVIRWLDSIGGSYRQKKTQAHHVVKPTMPCYQWQLSGRRDTLAFLEGVVPFMRIKKEKASLAIATLRSLLQPDLALLKAA